MFLFPTIFVYLDSLDGTGIMQSGLGVMHTVAGTFKLSSFDSKMNWKKGCSVKSRMLSKQCRRMHMSFDVASTTCAVLQTQTNPNQNNNNYYYNNHYYYHITRHRS